jgi:hypothetical protein
MVDDLSKTFGTIIRPILSGHIFPLKIVTYNHRASMHHFNNPEATFAVLIASPFGRFNCFFALQVISSQSSYLKGPQQENFGS